MDTAVVDWLCAGDVAVAYQVRRDLLAEPPAALAGLRARIATEGYGAALLAARLPNGHWGHGFYQPKWTSTHYTLLELRQLGLAPDHPAATEAVAMLLAREKGPDGGLNPSGTIARSDVCINGMALHYAAYFGAAQGELCSVVDFVLGQVMPDGGFNCRSNRSGATHASLHTTTSVLEGFTTYLRHGYRYRSEDMTRARDLAAEFVLTHRMYRSHRTGEVIHPEFTRFHHPARWRYDVLRGLDALAATGRPYDDRMADALALVRDRRRSDGRWVVARSYPGRTHVPPEPAGRPSRWVTLTAERVLRAYAPDRPVEKPRGVR